MRLPDIPPALDVRLVTKSEGLNLVVFDCRCEAIEYEARIATSYDFQAAERVRDRFLTLVGWLLADARGAQPVAVVYVDKVASVHFQWGTALAGALHSRRGCGAWCCFPAWLLDDWRPMIPAAALPTAVPV